MSNVSAISVESSRSEPPESSLAHLRAAHDAIAKFVEGWQPDPSAARQRAQTDSSAERQLAELSLQYANLERQLDAARAEAANRPAGGAAELANVHAALADSRMQNESLRNQLATARASEEQLRAALTQNQFEQRGLMAELHVLRYRTVELAEELSREKQHGMAERNLWNTELAQWRRLLETQFVRSGAAKRAALDTRSFATHVPEMPGTDAMLDSILTDFPMIEHHPKSES